MSIKIIAAASDNGVIGKNNSIPWKQRTDMINFRNQTIGNIVLMGSRTYDSLGQKPLKNRTNIIVTSNINKYKSIQDDKFQTIFSTTFKYAIDEAKKCAKYFNNDIFIIGGENIYKQALNDVNVNQILLTRIHVTLDGDRFFPELNNSWNLMNVFNCPSDEHNTYPYSFCIYKRQ